MIRRILIALLLIAGAADANVKSPSNASAAGGGTISSITSPNGTITVTNQTGPATNVDIPTSYLAAPPNIGGTTPAIGAFTTLTGSTSVISPIGSFSALGSITPGTGAFTTLSASSTVSGTGFSSYLASPPAIGGTTAAAGTFTTLTDTGLSTAGIITNTSGGLLGTTATVPVANGGTNLASYTQGQLLYASNSTTLAGLSDVATGSVLISGGTGTAPSYSTVLPASMTWPAPGAIGGTTPSTGSFTTLNFTTAGTIPTLNQNTTGTAANLSGTPALPSGTAATTQTAGDTSTKLATDAFVANIFAAPPTFGSTTPAPVASSYVRVTSATAPSGAGINLPQTGTLGLVGTNIASIVTTNLTSSALSSCGTSPSINATATDTKGTITEGTTATGCTLTFTTAYNTAPDCVVSSPSGVTPTSYTTSTNALTIVNASATGDKFTYHCIQ